MNTKLEIDIRSLIAHCEEMANEDSKDWRLKKYIKSLDTMISEFEEDKPPERVLDEYTKRCASLKTLTNYVQSPQIERKKLRSKFKDDSVIKEINQINQSNYTNALRGELLGTDNVLRQRKGGESESAAAKNYGDVQEKIAEDMLLLTKSLRDQTETANKIIKKDTEVVTNSAKLTEKNFGALKTESEKLQDHSKRAWKCWMWIMIGFVMMIFIFMVMFMKLMKKKS